MIYEKKNLNKIEIKFYLNEKKKYKIKINKIQKLFFKLFIVLKNHSK